LIARVLGEAWLISSAKIKVGKKGVDMKITTIVVTVKNT
jgi:hypothetical protein